MASATLSTRASAPVPFTLPTHFRSSETTDRCDPLDPDDASDVPVLTTDQRLLRLAVIAADTGARFVREGLPHDPVSWLLSPRALFSGRTAIDACQEREPFLRATLLHGLSLGLDAEAEDLDVLMSDDDEEGECPADGFGFEGSWNTAFDYQQAAEGVEVRPRLYSCIVEGPLGLGDSCVQAFCAMVVPSEDWARRRLQRRYGVSLAETAVVREGFDGDGVLAEMLLSDPMRRMLAAVARDPAGELGAGLDVQVEQRFAA